jgi:hypothetical protein
LPVDHDALQIAPGRPKIVPVGPAAWLARARKSAKKRADAGRNIVVTVWDWSSPTAYLHEEISTDKRNPTVNAYGPPSNITNSHC